MGKKVKHRRKEVDESKRPKGFVTVNKDLFWWFDSHFQSNRHEFSREEAMLWLLFNANYKKDKGIGIGELKKPISFLQTAFGWKNESRVEDFLNALIVEGTIERVGDKGDDWHIRIKNWSKNQKNLTPQGTPLGTPQGTPLGTPHNSLINTGVTESCTTPGTPLGTPKGTPLGTHNYNNNIDSSPVGSSSNYSNKTNINKPSSLRSDGAAAAPQGVGGKGFQEKEKEKDKGKVPFSLKDITDLILNKTGYKMDSLLEKIISDSYQKAKERSFFYKDGLAVTIDNLSERMIYLYKAQSGQNPNGQQTFSEK